MLRITNLEGSPLYVDPENFGIFPSPEADRRVYSGTTPMYSRPWEETKKNLFPQCLWHRVQSGPDNTYTIAAVGDRRPAEIAQEAILNAHDLYELGAGGGQTAFELATKLPQRPAVVAVDTGYNTAIQVHVEPDVPNLRFVQGSWETVKVATPEQPDLIISSFGIGYYGSPKAVEHLIDIAQPGCVVLATQDVSKKMKLPHELALRGHDVYVSDKYIYPQAVIGIIRK